MGLFLPLQTNFPNHFVGRKSSYFEGFDYSALMMDPLSRKIQKMQNLLAQKFYFPNPYRRSSFFLTDTRAQVSSSFFKKVREKPGPGFTIARASTRIHPYAFLHCGCVGLFCCYCYCCHFLLSFVFAFVFLECRKE